MLDDITNEYTSSLPYYEYSTVTEIPAGTNKMGMPAEQEKTIASPLEQLPMFPPAEERRSQNKLLYSIIGIFAVILVIIAGSTALLLYTRPASIAPVKITVHMPSGAPTGPAVNQFHYGACPFQLTPGIIEGQQVRCGVLVVPEDRSHPQGRTVQLAVAIFHAPGANASSSPELYLQGGPGGATLDDLGKYITRSNLAKVTLGHDLILLDQRGTGYSQPALNCPELYRSQNNSLSASSQDSQTQSVQAIRDCHSHLIQSGINLNKYTTIDDATDVHDLIHALGYKQVNLYGVSYGTRLALTVMRLFPADLRSVILDSTVPTQNNLFTQESAVTQHAFDVLFHGCATDVRCNTAYPQLESTFYSLVTSLNNHPASFQESNDHLSVTLDGNMLVEWLFSAMYDSRLIPELPKTIMEISRGNYDIISQYLSPILYDRGISDGMYFSVECGEDMAYTTMQELTQSTSVLRPEIRPDIQNNLAYMFATCQNWNENPVPTVQKQPVRSALPTLVLSGEYDPITPSSNAEQALRTLSNGSLFIFPATGHGVFYTNSCPDTIMSAFLANPDVKPDGSCIALMTGPAFQ